MLQIIRLEKNSSQKPYAKMVSEMTVIGICSHVSLLNCISQGEEIPNSRYIKGAMQQRLEAMAAERAAIRVVIRLFEFLGDVLIFKLFRIEMV